MALRHACPDAVTMNPTPKSMPWSSKFEIDLMRRADEHRRDRLPTSDSWPAHGPQGC